MKWFPINKPTPEQPVETDPFLVHIRQQIYLRDARRRELCSNQPEHLTWQARCDVHSSLLNPKIRIGRE